MRILLTTESRKWSGGAAQTVLLAQELLRLGHTVWVGCRSGSDVFNAAQSTHIPIFPIRIRGDMDFIAVVRLLRFIQKERIDVLHAQHPKAHGVGLLTARLTRRPLALVVTRRVSFHCHTHFFSRWKYTSRRIDAFIAVSQGIKDVLVSDGVQPEKAHVIYSAVHPESFRPAPLRTLETLRTKLKLKRNLPVLIKVANYSDWKGQMVFLEAAAHLLAQGCPAQFVLVGRDTDGSEVAQKIRRLGLEPHVLVLGFRTDIPNLLSLSTGSVNSAVSGEGLSGALRESLFLGIPVIATDVSGNRELVVDGETGRLVPPGDPEALAEAMRWVLKNQSQARQLAQAGQERVKSLMQIEQIARQIEALYRTITSL